MFSEIILGETNKVLIKSVTICLVSIILLSACTTSSSVKVEGLSDPLEKKIKIHTISYFKPFIIIDGSQDWFLRADIDKKTKQQNYQLYVTFNSVEWAYWDHARFKTETGDIEYPVKRISGNAKCENKGCAHYEDVILDVNANTLNQWAKSNTVVSFSSSKVAARRDVVLDKKEVTEFLAKIQVILASNF